MDWQVKCFHPVRPKSSSSGYPSAGHTVTIFVSGTQDHHRILISRTQLSYRPWNGNITQLVFQALTDQLEILFSLEVRLNNQENKGHFIPEWLDFQTRLKTATGLIHISIDVTHCDEGTDKILSSKSVLAIGFLTNWLTLGRKWVFEQYLLWIPKRSPAGISR